MTRDGMPRAYLRLDPNIDQTHPDVEGFVRLMCAAARQPERGRFRDRSVLDRAVGRSRVARAIERGDVVSLPDGRLYLDGWDEWQEGDHTVAERMKRMRARRSANRHSAVSPVTAPPSPGRIDVTTDAVAKGVVGIVGGDDGADSPPTPAKRGLRSNGTNPRAIAARTAEVDRDAEHQRRLATTQRRINEVRAVG